MCGSHNERRAAPAGYAPLPTVDPSIPRTQTQASSSDAASHVTAAGARASLAKVAAGASGTQ
eukprot:854110-Amphidinium_carterae.1